MYFQFLQYRHSVPYNQQGVGIIVRVATALSFYFIGLFWGPQAVAEAAADSAYQRLRWQFERSETPIESSLAAGEVWYCSGSLEAAKGLFRYVPLWEARYQFAPVSSEQVDNVLQTRVFPLTYSHMDIRGTLVLRNQKRVYEFLRMNKEGNLIIEHASLFNATNSSRKAFSPAALSSKQMVADSYTLCENPRNHENRQWGDKPFDQNKKRASIEDEDSIYMNEWQ